MVPTRAGPADSARTPTSSKSPSYVPYKTIEIKPKTTRNLILAGLASLLFVVLGIWMVSTGDAKDKGIGILAICFFGGIGLFIPRTIRVKTTFILSDDSITQMSVFGNSVLPWSDIERVGLLKVAPGRINILVALRLKSYDRYLASVSPEMAEAFSRYLPIMRVMTRAISLLDLPQQQLLKLWSAFNGEEEPEEVLKSFGKVGSYAQALIWNREHYGYDLTLGWHLRDRSAEDFAELLEDYRSHAATRM